MDLISHSVERQAWARRNGVSILIVVMFLGTIGLGPTLAASIPRALSPLPHALVRSAGVDTPASELAMASSSLNPTGPTGAVPATVRPLTTPTLNWTQVRTPTPTTTEEDSLVYDAVDKEYVLFGGYNASGVTKQTWTYSLSGVWTPLSTSGAPPARVGAQIAYDAADHYVVLFGGENSSVLADTWKFVGGKWTKLSPATHPPATAFGSMTYDAAAGDVLLFGGFNSAFTDLNTTWTFKGGAWTKLTPSRAPSPRNGAQLSDDPKDGTPILFGGYTPSGTTASDTWDFNGGTWHHVTTPGAPPGRAYGAMAFDPSDAKVILSTGYNSTTGHVLADTWEYGGGKWNKVATTYNPSGRYVDASADGTNTTGVMLFGGDSRTGPVSDVWSFQKGDWHSVHPKAPAARYLDSLVWDAADRYVVLFGGVTSSGVFLGDTWKFANGVWTPIYPKVSPLAVAGTMMTYDGTDGYVLLFSGATPTGYSYGTWSFHHGQWKEQGSSSATVPPGRAGASMSYDAQDGYVVLFGGYNFSYPYNSGLYRDTWTYAGGVWNTSFASGPSPRDYAEISYDSTDGIVVLFGGESTGYTAYSDTWEFSNGYWYNVTSSAGSPIGSAFGAAVDDTYDSYVLLFGGYNSSYGVLPYAYSFSYGSWNYQPVSAFPPGWQMFGMAYDPAISGAVLFGGLNATSVVSAQTWTVTG